MIDSDEATASQQISKQEELKIMSLSRFEPLVNFRVFEDAFNRILTEPQTNRPWSPAVDIYETENELVLKADLPEVDSKDVDVRVENLTLTISGERKFESEKSEKGFHRIERSYGNFTRSFTLPNTFDTSNVAAAFKNGVLTIKLPKKEAAKPRQIKIEAAN
jgi:HSP20 family protein